MRLVAGLSAQTLWARDKASLDLGKPVLELGPGRAKLAMTLTERMVNGHGLGHGGFIFTLADSALAVTCNSYGYRCVAPPGSVTFVTPARRCARLLAEATQRHRAARSGIYDGTVREEAGDRRVQGALTHASRQPARKLAVAGA